MAAERDAVRHLVADVFLFHRSGGGHRAVHSFKAVRQPGLVELAEKLPRPCHGAAGRIRDGQQWDEHACPDEEPQRCHHRREPRGRLARWQGGESFLRGGLAVPLGPAVLKGRAPTAHGVE